MPVWAQGWLSKRWACYSSNQKGTKQLLKTNHLQKLELEPEFGKMELGMENSQYNLNLVCLQQSFMEWNSQYARAQGINLSKTSTTLKPSIWLRSTFNQWLTLDDNSAVDAVKPKMEGLTTLYWHTILNHISVKRFLSYIGLLQKAEWESAFIHSAKVHSHRVWINTIWDVAWKRWCCNKWDESLKSSPARITIAVIWREQVIDYVVTIRNARPLFAIHIFTSIITSSYT
jgi:hypothetical protein